MPKPACGAGDRAAPLQTRPRSLPPIDASSFDFSGHCNSQSRSTAPRRADGATKIMNRLQRGDDADARPSGARPLVVTFLAMAAAEWRKLVAEVSHTFRAKRAKRTTIKDEQLGGR
jgi:hypothetical protein